MVPLCYFTYILNDNNWGSVNHDREFFLFMKQMKKKFKKKVSRAWFRSTDLWVMGPARFHCATLLMQTQRN